MLKKNDSITVKIEDFSHDGAGIGKINGYPIFIKDAIIGDTVLAEIMKAKANYAFAKLKKVITSSSFRIKPECEHHRRCGGCQLQTLSYEKQLEYKQKKVRNNLLRIGGFTTEEIDVVIEPIIGMEKPFRYRNKAQYPFGSDKEGKPVTGFYAGRTHDIIANTDCPLGDKRNKEILETILTYMKENHVSAYNEITGEGLIRHVLIRSGYLSGELMVCLVLNTKAKAQIKQLLPKQQALITGLTKIPGLAGITVNLNAEKTNVIMGQEVYTIWGRDVINDEVRIRDAENNFADTGRSLKFCISPLSFYQVNPIQTEKLYSIALKYAGLTGRETVWDLYSGIGTISLFMAAAARQVYGIEIIPEAVKDASRNAKINNIKNAAFFAGKVEEILPKKLTGENFRADIIIVDPPRKGCDDECLKTIIKIKPEKIIYISCDSATLARDLRFLCENGYTLNRVRPVDQFPQTVHVETVCLVKIDESRRQLAEDKTYTFTTDELLCS